jgi:hypothetical protein
MDNLNQEITKTELQLRECLVARGGLEDDFGRLLVDLYAKHITRLTREITSDKYRKDHAGYNNCLSDLNAYQRILKELQAAAAPARESKLRERLEQLDES